MNLTKMLTRTFTAKMIEQNIYAGKYSSQTKTLIRRHTSIHGGCSDVSLVQISSKLWKNILPSASRRYCTPTLGCVEKHFFPRINLKLTENCPWVWTTHTLKYQ